MRKGFAVATTTLALLSGCRAEVLEAGGSASRNPAPEASADALTHQNPDVLSLAARYSPELLTTSWRETDSIAFRGADVLVLQENVAGTEAGAGMLQNALHNVGVMLDSVSSGETAVPPGFEVDVGSDTQNVYVIYGG